MMASQRCYAVAKKTIWRTLNLLCGLSTEVTWGESPPPRIVLSQSRFALFHTLRVSRDPQTHNNRHWKDVQVLFCFAWNVPFNWKPMADMMNPGRIIHSYLLMWHTIILHLWATHKLKRTVLRVMQMLIQVGKPIHGTIHLAKIYYKVDEESSYLGISIYSLSFSTYLSLWPTVDHQLCPISRLALSKNQEDYKGLTEGHAALNSCVSTPHKGIHHNIQPLYRTML